MAYNSYSNNKEYNKPFEPSVYSPYRFNNAESSVDKTCLTFDIWKRMLKITISPRKEGTEEIQFDTDKGLSVYINHAKAYILANELRNFLRDPETYNGSGIPSGQGVISISNGSEFGVNFPLLVIRKLDETGNVVSSFAYEFKRDYYFSIRNYNGGSSFNKESDSYQTLEIEEMILLLEEYYKAMTYMIAYSVVDVNKYNQDRLTSRLNAIAEKLGVEVKSGGRSGGSSGYSSTSFFNNAPSSNQNESYVPSTIDDID